MDCAPLEYDSTSPSLAALLSIAPEYVLLEFSQKSGYLGLSKADRKRFNISSTVYTLGECTRHCYTAVPYHLLLPSPFPSPSSPSPSSPPLPLPLPLPLLLPLSLVLSPLLPLPLPLSVLDLNNVTCFGGTFGQMLHYYCLGFETTLINSYRYLMDNDSSRGEQST